MIVVGKRMKKHDRCSWSAYILKGTLATIHDPELSQCGPHSGCIVCHLTSQDLSSRAKTSLGHVGHWATTYKPEGKSLGSGTVELGQPRCA